MSMMKARSLKHLLLLTAKKINKKKPIRDRIVEQICSTLEVDFTGRYLLVTWEIGKNQNKEIAVSLNEFIFYKVGDKPSEASLHPREIEDKNEKKANDLWKQILKSSGIEYDTLVSSNYIVGKKRTATISSVAWSIFGFTLLYCTNIYMGQEKVDALTLALVPALLPLWLLSLSYTHLQATPRWYENLCCILGTSLPIFLGLRIDNQISFTLYLAGLIIFSQFEEHRRLASYSGFVGGLIFGIGSSLSRGGLYLTLFNISFFSLVSILTRYELRKRSYMLLSFGTVISLLAITIFYAQSPKTSDVLSFFEVVNSLGLLIMGSIWWIYGIVRKISAWFLIIATGLYGLMDLYDSNSHIVLTCSGFLLVLIFRYSSGLLNVRAKN